jgi:hypothetical protein
MRAPRALDLDKWHSRLQTAEKSSCTRTPPGAQPRPGADQAPTRALRDDPNSVSLFLRKEEEGPRQGPLKQPIRLVTVSLAPDAFIAHEHTASRTCRPVAPSTILPVADDPLKQCRQDKEFVAHRGAIEAFGIPQERPPMPIERDDHSAFSDGESPRAMKEQVALQLLQLSDAD